MTAMPEDLNPLTEVEPTTPPISPTVSMAAASQSAAQPSNRRWRMRVARPRSLTGKGFNLLVLVVVWLLLQGEFSWGNLLAGTVLAIVVTLLFPMPAIPWPGRFHLWGTLRLIVVVTADLALASVSLAAFALNLRRQPRSGVVAVPLSSDADLYQVATGTVLSIVPGSVVVEARWRTRTLYMHIFDLSDDDAASVRVEARRAELWILRAFGNRRDIAKASAELEGATDFPRPEDRISREVEGKA